MFLCDDSGNHWLGRHLPVVFLFGVLFTFAVAASGQAWLPDKGEGTVSTSYDYVAFAGHFRSDGSKTPEAASRARSFLFELEYGATDKLAITVSLPIVSVRYADTNPSSDTLRILFEQAIQQVDSGFYNHKFLDDGQYHTAVQDFRFNVRYKLASRYVVVTPFIASTLPSHDYAFVGEASPGRNLKEIESGTNVARRLDPFLPKAYVDGQFAFAIPEAALNVRTKRMNVSLEMGYLLKRRLALRGFGQWQHTLAGLHFPADLTTPELSLTHERLLKADYWHVGGGASYAISSKVDVSADVVTFLSGSDTHYGTGLALGVSRSFRLRSAPRRLGTIRKTAD